MAALSQLSYSPSEVVLLRKVNTCELVIAGRRQPKLNSVPPGEDLRRKKEGPVERLAIGGE